MWQFTEPIIEIDNCFHALGEHSEITSVDEDVAVRKPDLAMTLMRVAKEDKAQGGSLYGSSTRLFHTLTSGAGRVLGKIPQIFFPAADPTGAGGPLGKRFWNSTGPQGLGWRPC
jgi:hypothetical protein